MELKKRLQQDVVTAMKEGDTFTRDTLRGLMAAIKQVEVDERITLSDAQVQGILTKQAKQRRESIVDAERAGRTELGETEKAELALIENYLPQLMSRQEIEPIAASTIAELGVTNVKGMGRVMGVLMPKLKGKADGQLISQVVREMLQGA